jgi:hypothetical protein
MLSASEARQLLRTAGFSILSTRFLFVFPRMLSWMRGFEALLSPIPLGGQYVILAQRRP